MSPEAQFRHGREDRVDSSPPSWGRHLEELISITDLLCHFLLV